jgi:hypothetical protein
MTVEHELKPEIVEILKNFDRIAALIPSRSRLAYYEYGTIGMAVEAARREFVEKFAIPIAEIVLAQEVPDVKGFEGAGEDAQDPSRPGEHTSPYPEA